MRCDRLHTEQSFRLSACLYSDQQQTVKSAQPAHCCQILQATGGAGVDVIVEMLANVNLATDLKV